MLQEKPVVLQAINKSTRSVINRERRSVCVSMCVCLCVVCKRGSCIKLCISAGTSFQEKVPFKCLQVSEPLHQQASRPRKK